MRAIFVSYRRHDAEGEAGRLFDDLVEQFDENSVFMDVAAIEVGRDFRKAIDESIATCGVLLAIIGTSWLDQKNDSGLRRLDDPADFVRAEIASALRRDIAVVPVLVRGAHMPRAEQLPDDIRDLAYRNAVELTHVRWKSDIKILIRSLRNLLGDSRGIVPTRGIVTSQESMVTDMAKYWNLSDSAPAVPRPNPSNFDGTGPSANAPSALRPPSIPGLVPPRFSDSRSPSVPSTAVAAASSSVAGVPQGNCNSSLDPALTSRVAEELAEYIGPIAEVVVKRAARQCATVADLRRMVAEEIEAGPDRTRFLSACSGN